MIDHPWKDDQRDTIALLLAAHREDHEAITIVLGNLQDPAVNLLDLCAMALVLMAAMGIDPERYAQDAIGHLNQ